MRADAQSIKAIVSMPDVLSAMGIRVDRRRIPCPIRDHKRKDPSFVIKPNSWTCHACGDGGDIFTFVQRMNGGPFPEAIQWICNAFQIPNDGKPDHELNKRIQARRDATEARKREREYQGYAWGRMCDYLHWLEAQKHTEFVDKHLEWCNDMLDRMFAGCVLFDGKTTHGNIDDRLRGMWQQHQKMANLS